MRRKKGFTIIELMISMALMVILVSAITYTFLVCFRAFDSGQDRSAIRTKLFQATDLMTRELYDAQSIGSCTSTSLTFNANLGSGVSAYTFSLSGSNLISDGGVVRATGIQTPGGSIANIFSCSNALVTIDMTAVKNDASVRLQTNIIPRNMPVGLAGWWALNDGSGTSAADSSGNNNTGTLINTPAWVTGQTGCPYSTALSLNGTSQLVAVPATNLDSTFAGANKQFTISAWIKPGSTMTNNIIVGRYSTSDSQRQFFLRLQTGSALEFLWYDGNGGTKYEGTLGSTAITNTSNWYHVAMTYDGTNSTISNRVSLYVNGTADTTSINASTGSPAQLETSTVQMGIGGEATVAGGGVGFYFKGSIDDVRIYNRVLSASEVSELYNAGIGN